VIGSILSEQVKVEFTVINSLWSLSSNIILTTQIENASDFDIHLIVSPGTTKSSTTYYTSSETQLISGYVISPTSETFSNTHPMYVTGFRIRTKDAHNSITSSFSLTSVDAVIKEETFLIDSASTINGIKMFEGPYYGTTELLVKVGCFPSCTLRFYFDRSDDRSKSRFFTRTVNGAESLLVNPSIRFFPGDTLRIYKISGSTAYMDEINFDGIMHFRFPTTIRINSNYLNLETSDDGSSDGWFCKGDTVCRTHLQTDTSGFNWTATNDLRNSVVEGIKNQVFVTTIETINPNLCMADGPFDNLGVNDSCSATYAPPKADCMTHDVCYECMRCFYSGDSASFTEFCNDILFEHCKQSDPTTISCTVVNLFVDGWGKAKEGKCQNRQLCTAWLGLFDRVIDKTCRIGLWDRLSRDQYDLNKFRSDCWRGVIYDGKIATLETGFNALMRC